MINKAKSTLLIILLGLIPIISGCNLASKPAPPDPKPVIKEELRRLLPTKPGYKWVYSGFAEYGHTMELKTIPPQKDSLHFLVTGQVADMSDGEAKGNFALEIEYSISGDILRQKKKAEKMLDSLSDDLEIIRLPLKAKSQWTQKIKDQKGQEYEFLCTIDNILEKEGKKEYVVLYQDKNSAYYEKRIIREETGIIFFEKLWQSPEGAFEIGYSLYEEASGYGK